MATDLSSLLEGGVILPSFNATSRKQAIHALAEGLAEATGLGARQIEDAVMERERLGSTGVGEGVAIPHARVDGLEKPVGGFLRLDEGVDFEAIDERPCDLIFMLLAPKTAGADHLRALAQVSRVFRQGAVRDALREARTEEDVRAVVCREAAEPSV
ncbi:MULTISPECIES: PTS sugar transporter subunit IIA [Hyphomonas]|uniref:Sugar phosphotransferase system (PTS),mannose/fructose family protein n=2 Tax=Hyphomonas adhaerens TaxID=81029 RepID=A0A069E343_9PROT|nr:MULTISPECIES: PTS sugar transporter subunit IIA [Hyphomonas]KCZ84570.1 sugar phosphotransferase system (PTS),mannose/fructose family protein [Hyphomonas adhaerens MHS-3]MBB39740.1 transcriptional regulator [Hyphomonas sp.]HAE27333.1 transcriptional regulator [Hyphomonas adhaerens]|tara:strand:+ start:185 stop:655 length:471 start_codon:yes stop_codon:yes gene_type:complete